MDKAMDEVIGLFLVLIGIAVFINGVILFVILWAIISAFYAKYIYDKYFAEAEEDFDDMMHELNIDLPIDEVIGTVGINVDQNDHYETIIDMVAGENDYGTPLGETDV